MLTGDQGNDMGPPQEVVRELVRQAREAGDAGRAQLQAELQGALQALQGQLQQVRQQQIDQLQGAVNGGVPAGGLRARLEELERQVLRPEGPRLLQPEGAHGRAGLPFAERDLRGAGGLLNPPQGMPFARQFG